LICEETVSNQHGKRDLKASIRELAVALERGLEDHPAPRELQNFVAGDLSKDERERIESHLAICRDCTRAALDLAEPTELELVKRGEILTERELAAQWKRFQAAAGISRRRRLPPLRAIAAVLLLALLGMTAWAFLRESQSQTDMFLVDVGSTTRGLVKTVSLPNWAGRVQLVIDLPYQTPEYPEYHVEIRVKGGRRVSRDRVYQQEDGTLTVQVPRRRLPEGAYEIRVADPQGRQLVIHDLLIEP
jgi:hypothetical protein